MSDLDNYMKKMMAEKTSNKLYRSNQSDLNMHAMFPLAQEKRPAADLNAGVVLAINQLLKGVGSPKMSLPEVVPNEQQRNTAAKIKTDAELEFWKTGQPEMAIVERMLREKGFLK
jgi:hypothetical protein